MAKQTFSKTYEHEIDDADFGRAFELEIEIDFSVDHHWGADADGNRGITVYEQDCTDYSITEWVQVLPSWLLKIVQVFNPKAKGGKWKTWELEDLPKAVQEAIEKILYQDFEEDYEEPERDWDAYNDERRDER